MRCALAAFIVGLCTASMLAVGANAAAKPGWSVAKASAFIEFNVRIPSSDVIAAAKEHLRTMRLVGGSQGIAEAQTQVKLAQAGFEVDRASCLGTKAAPGGYVVFRCKLVLRDGLGFTAKATGTFRKLASAGKWAWDRSTLTLNPGPCPDNWTSTSTNRFCN